MQALVVVAHPCDDSFTHAAAERGRHRPAGRRTRRGGRRPVCARLSCRDVAGGAPRLSRRDATHRRARARTRASGRVGRLPRVRVPDMVERSAGDVEGLARARDGARAWRSCSTNAAARCAPACDHVRRSGRDQLLRFAPVGREADQRQRAPHDHAGAAHVVRTSDRARPGSACTASTRRASHAATQFLDRVETTMARLT